MTDQRSILTNFVPATHEDWKVTGIGGTQLIVQGQGDVEILSSFNSTKHHGIKLKQFFFSLYLMTIINDDLMIII